MLPTKELEEMLANTARSESLDESLCALEFLLSGGFSVWEDGSIYEIRQLIARVGKLRIQVYAKEHPPPHFHIVAGDLDATFSVVDGRFLMGRIGPREKALVAWWYKHSRPTIIAAWNRTRPSDCPVGPIDD